MSTSAQTRARTLEVCFNGEIHQTSIDHEIAVTVGNDSVALVVSECDSEEYVIVSVDPPSRLVSVVVQAVLGLEPSTRKILRSELKQTDLAEIYWERDRQMGMSHRFQ